jgi:hypothetical protein
MLTVSFMEDAPLGVLEPIVVLLPPACRRGYRSRLQDTLAEFRKEYNSLLDHPKKDQEFSASRMKPSVFSGSRRHASCRLIIVEGL